MPTTITPRTVLRAMSDAPSTKRAVYRAATRHGERCASCVFLFGEAWRALVRARAVVRVGGRFALRR